MGLATHNMHSAHAASEIYIPFSIRHMQCAQGGTRHVVTAPSQSHHIFRFLIRFFLLLLFSYSYLSIRHSTWRNQFIEIFTTRTAHSWAKYEEKTNYSLCACAAELSLNALMCESETVWITIAERRCVNEDDEKLVERNVHAVDGWCAFAAHLTRVQSTTKKKCNWRRKS